MAATLAATPQKLYSQDLDSFIAALEDYEARELKQLNALEERQRRALGKGKGKAKKVSRQLVLISPQHGPRMHILCTALILYVFVQKEKYL